MTIKRIDNVLAGTGVETDKPRERPRYTAKLADVIRQYSPSWAPMPTPGQAGSMHPAPNGIVPPQNADDVADLTAAIELLQDFQAGGVIDKYDHAGLGNDWDFIRLLARIKRAIP